MNYDELTAEQREKLNGCRTPEDVIELAKQEGYELTDAEAARIAGGESDDSTPVYKCPRCGSTDVQFEDSGRTKWCKKCGTILHNHDKVF